MELKRSRPRLGLAVGLSGLLLGLLFWALTPFSTPDVPAEAPPPSTWNFQALPAPAPGTRTLGGQVLGPEGPVAEALVIALPPPSAAWRSLSVPLERRQDTCRPDPAVVSVLEQVEAHRADAVPLARATTDAEGRFQLAGLGPDPVLLWAEHGLLLGLSEAVSPGGPEVPLRVRPGERLASQVLDEEGLPLAGVTVTALVRAAGRVVETVTHEDGRFVLGPLPDREPVVLSKPGFRTASHDPRDAPRMTARLASPHRLSGQVRDERGAVAGTTVRLEDLPTLDAVTTDARGRFAFEDMCASRYVLVARRAERAARQWVDVPPGREGPPVDLFLQPSVLVSGRVTDTSGRALAEAEVRASDGAGRNPRVLQTRTDARGRFQLELLTPGRYAVTAQAPRYLAERVPARLFVSSQELDLILQDATVVEGVVVDERGTPVQGMRLRPMSVRGWESATAVSDADGRFQLEFPRSGSWRVRTGHPDFFTADVTLDAPARDARVVLQRGASLEFRLADAEGQPVERATLTLLASDNVRPRRGDTDRDGQVTFRPLPPGEYTVQSCAFQISEQITLAAGESRTVRRGLPRGGRLRVQVVDTQGTPLEGADVSLGLISSGDSPCHEPLRFQSGAEGVFSWALPEGTWRLSASAPGMLLDQRASRGVELASAWKWNSVQVRIASGESRVQLVLRPREGTLRGRVVRPDGQPITAFQLNERMMRDSDGRFSVARPSVRWLELKAPGLPPFRMPLASTSTPKDLDLGDVVLAPGVSLEGTVVDALSSAPVARALVGIQNPNDPASPGRPLTYTGPDGHFTLEGVPPTDLPLVIEHPLYPRLEVTLTPGPRVEVRLPPGAILEGRVESGGLPLGGGSLQLRTPQGALAATTEVWRGRYLLESLPAGRYTVRIQGPRREGTPFLFPLRDVELTAGARTTLDFEGQRSGVSVEVLVPERNIEVYLVPGELPLLGPHEGLHNRLREGFLGKHVSETARRFPLLPEGLYTLIALREDENTDVHRELLELPAEGERNFTLTPIWNRYEE